MVVGVSGTRTPTFPIPVAHVGVRLRLAPTYDIATMRPTAANTAPRPSVSVASFS